ncbi:MAG: SpoIIE family protein phosphatase [Desulfatibacillaceae bacterium]
MDSVFDNLRESNEFLNNLLDNIDAAVLVADEKLRVHQFNRTFENLFESSPVDDAAPAAFGNMAGCQFCVEDNTNCGQSSHCRDCAIRQALLRTLLERVPVEREYLSRVFYTNGVPTEKHLQFSTRPISHRGQSMIMVIIHDVTDLENSKRHLVEKQELLDQDLVAAAAIQRSLLPDRSLDHDRVRMAWEFEPSGRIGGDIFNLHHMTEDFIAVYMADVCGHGVSAAMISVAVSQFLQTLRARFVHAPENFRPSVVLDRLERAFPFEKFDSFHTMVYAALDLKDGLLRYGVAGHPPPLLVRADGGLDVLDVRGPVVGAGQGEHVQGEERLAPGDRLVLYTDGVTDAMSPEGAMFGMEGLETELLRTRNLDNDAMLAAVHEAVRKYVGKGSRDDDISLLSLEYLGG